MLLSLLLLVQVLPPTLGEGAYQARPFPDSPVCAVDDFLTAVKTGGGYTDIARATEKVWKDFPKEPTTVWKLGDVSSNHGIWSVSIRRSPPVEIGYQMTVRKVHGRYMIVGFIGESP